MAAQRASPNEREIDMRESRENSLAEKLQQTLLIGHRSFSDDFLQTVGVCICTCREGRIGKLEKRGQPREKGISDGVHVRRR